MNPVLFCLQIIDTVWTMSEDTPTVSLPLNLLTLLLTSKAFNSNPHLCKTPTNHSDPAMDVSPAAVARSNAMRQDRSARDVHLVNVRSGAHFVRSFTADRQCQWPPPPGGPSQKRRRTGAPSLSRYTQHHTTGPVSSSVDPSGSPIEDLEWMGNGELLPETSKLLMLTDPYAKRPRAAR